jgi:hypothetical protein
VSPVTLVAMTLPAAIKLGSNSIAGILFLFGIVNPHVFYIVSLDGDWFRYLCSLVVVWLIPAGMVTAFWY